MNINMNNNINININDNITNTIYSGPKKKLFMYFPLCLEKMGG